MSDLKYYYRKITKRVPINKYGKLGYRPYIEVVLTSNIEPFNKRKQYKFKEMGLNDLDNIDLTLLNANEVYEFESEW